MQYSLDPQNLLSQLQAAQDKANKANEARYQQILGLYDTLGKAGQTRIEQQATKQQALGTQDLISRGLGNTTITSALSRGIATDAELQQQSLQEGLTQQKAGVMERKTEQGPDLGLYSSLLQSAMSAPSSSNPTTSTRYSGEGVLDAWRSGSGAGGGGGGSSGSGGSLSMGSGGGGGNTPAGQAQYFGPSGGKSTSTPSSPLVFQPLAMGSRTEGGTIDIKRGTAPENTSTFDSLTGAAASPLISPMDLGGGQKKYKSYAEYKKAAGTSAVSPMYYDAVYGGFK